jgi:hypothetical protein
MDIIKANPDKPWNWIMISENPNLTIEMILSNPNKQWNWNEISRNPNITMDIIKANPDKPWNWIMISENPNLTIEMILSNPDKIWSWFLMSRNPFIKEKELFELRILKMNHQQFVQNYLFEELVKIALHPDKINKYLEMGYTIDELDDIM